ncbi:MAG: hypothetical protein ABIR62_01615 [Dokdonella sp.]|uniref:hypothetical protein n=1 Tax=Dokdonella sp. TaxID=2291710 RepID=UPI00326456B7
MNRLLVLTLDEPTTRPDQQIIVVRESGQVACYLYVDTIDRLAHDRHEDLPEAQARALMA